MVVLRREFENEFHRNQRELPAKTIVVSTNQSDLKNTIEQFESTRIDTEEKNSNEEKETDQLPDYSIYDDDVNASILRVLRNEEGVEEPTSNPPVCFLKVISRKSL